MERIDDLLTRLLGNTQPYSPPLELREKTAEYQAQPPRWIPVHVPDNRGVYTGYMLDTGQVELVKAVYDNAMLLVTKDLNFIHINEDHNVSIKQDGEKKRLGSLHIEGSSPFLEKEKPLTLVIGDMGHSSEIFVAPLLEVIVYDPQPALQATYRRKNQQPTPTTNISSLLLRQFLS